MRSQGIFSGTLQIVPSTLCCYCSLQTSCSTLRCNLQQPLKILSYIILKNSNLRINGFQCQTEYIMSFASTNKMLYLLLSTCNKIYKRLLFLSSLPHGNGRQC